MKIKMEIQGLGEKSNRTAKLTTNVENYSAAVKLVDTFREQFPAEQYSMLLTISKTTSYSQIVNNLETTEQIVGYLLDKFEKE